MLAHLSFCFPRSVNQSGHGGGSGSHMDSSQQKPLEREVPTCTVGAFASDIGLLHSLRSPCPVLYVVCIQQGGHHEFFSILYG